MVKDKKDKRVKKAVVYTIVGIDTNAQKSLLGFYSFFGSENKSTWMDVFQDLINRGLKKVLMFICDDFRGISEAIKAYFPLSDIQKCTVHLARNIYRHMKKEDALYNKISFLLLTFYKFSIFLYSFILWGSL
jgi:putative transposase